MLDYVLNLSLNGKLGIIATIFLFYTLASTFISWYKLRHIPGPLLASISYGWVLNKALRGRTADYEHLTKYGSLVRVGPRYLVTDDPKVIRQLSSARSTSDRDEWYTGASLEEHRNLFAAIKAKPHDELKAKAAHAYAGRDGLNFERAVDDMVIHLKQVIRSRYLSSSSQIRPVDFAQLVRSFALDVITHTGFGQKIGFMDYDGDMFGFARGLGKATALVSAASDVPVVRYLLKNIFGPLALFPKDTDTKGAGKIMGIGYNLVKQRFRDNKIDQNDMVGSFMRHGMTEEETKTEAFSQVVAGEITTSTAIRSIMIFLATCPRAYARLKRDIQQAMRDKKLSEPIATDDAKSIPYLQAVIYEGLRMRPPAVYGFYKKVGPQAELINGFEVPAGTAVGWNGPALMKNKSIFGQDAQIYRPERFLECDESQMNNMIRDVELVFGSGRWLCAGKKLALIEINKVIYELMRSFEFQVMNPACPWKEDSYTVYVQREMWLSITEDSDNFGY